MQELSNDAKAILLLTSPLIYRYEKEQSDCLTLDEYNHLTKLLRAKGMRPGDLLVSSGIESVHLEDLTIDPDRINRLLSRGFSLAQLVDIWQKYGVWILTRADKEYPLILKRRMGLQAPAILFGCGAIDLLNRKKFALLSTQRGTQEGKEMAKDIARQAGKSDCTILLGSSPQIDDIAFEEILATSGYACFLFSGELKKKILSSHYVQPLRDKRLVILSTQEPLSRMTQESIPLRNKVTIALSDACFILNAEPTKGDLKTPIEEMLLHVPDVLIYLNEKTFSSRTMEKLCKIGARRWNVQTASTKIPEQVFNPYDGEPIVQDLFSNHRNDDIQNVISSAEFIKNCVEKVLKRVLANRPMAVKEIATNLEINEEQMLLWLRFFQKKGVVCCNEKGFWVSKFLPIDVNH